MRTVKDVVNAVESLCTTFQVYPEQLITVWEFRSVDGKQVVLKIYPARGSDKASQHEYQRVVYTGPRSGYKG